MERLEDLQLGDRIMVEFGRGLSKGKVVAKKGEKVYVKTSASTVVLSNDSWRDWYFVRRPKCLFF